MPTDCVMLSDVNPERETIFQEPAVSAIFLCRYTNGADYMRSLPRRSLTALITPSGSTKKIVGVLRQDIIDGSFNPFDGELRSQEGIVRTQQDPPLTSNEIIMMDWLNENIIGEIPVIASLTEEAQETVKFSGVEKTKREDAL